MANAEGGRVCKPDCEYWSGAPLSIKRCCRHSELAQRSMPEGKARGRAAMLTTAEWVEGL